ncbi:MAG: CapA family protein [Anaerolineales bacterium]|nr:CapA family protein [Anaerolineales bacterium]
MFQVPRFKFQVTSGRWLLVFILHTSYFILLTSCAAPTAEAPLLASSQLPLATNQPPTATNQPPTATAKPTVVNQPPATATLIPTSTTSPTPLATATATATPEPPTATPSYVVHLAAVGDINLDRTLGTIISTNGRPAYPFAAMAPYLTAADFTVGNFESALGDVGEPTPGKSYSFQSPPEAASALWLGGFDLVSLANNHALDYGPDSLLQGMGLLAEWGIAHVGAGANKTAARAPYIVEVNGLTLAFLGYVNVPVEASYGFDVQTWDATDDAPGLAWGTVAVIQEDVAAVAPEVDHVIVILHSGYEYLQSPSPIQVELSYAAVDAGASLVIGHHAHVLQGVEFYKGAMIAWGLGNFAFTIDGDPSTAVLNVWLTKQGVVDYNLVPAVIEESGAPRPATAEEAAAIFERIGPSLRSVP